MWSFSHGIHTQKFKDYFSNKFVFYVDYMAIVYLMNKSQVCRRIAR